MNGLAAGIVRFGAGFLALLSLGWVLTGSAAAPHEQGLPSDWTHRHIIFSKPSTAEQMKRVSKDPRYLQQSQRNNALRLLPPESDAAESIGESLVAKVVGPKKTNMRRDWSMSLGSGASVGAGNFAAKYSLKTSVATCGGANADFVVYPTGLTGTTGQATIVAYDNLYAGCGGTVPSVYWAYNLGNAGQILTSPIFSLDGKQVAFVASNNGEGILVLLKWAASTTESVGSPKLLAPKSASQYTTCTAPCMTYIYLQDNASDVTDDQTSSIFYDYSTDMAWVGGAGGWLHEIGPVFNGTTLNPPSEVDNGIFPVEVNSGVNALSSPVYDTGSNSVFVGDLGGFFYRVNAATGAVTATGRLDYGQGLVAGPIVDSTAGLVYVFASNNGTLNCQHGTGPCTAVYIFNTSFPSGTLGTDVAVGGSIPSPPSPLYEGAFDQTYLNSTNATGNLYVCGNTGQRPIMYQVPVNGGVMGPIVTGGALATNTATCSPVTDVYNPTVQFAPGVFGPEEWIFASTTTLGYGQNCNSGMGGCLISFVDLQWTPATTYVVGQEVLDSNYHNEVVLTAGISGATTPPWNIGLAGTTTDGTVTWLDQGHQTASYGFWHALWPNFDYPDEIVDVNNNIELCTNSGGTSGASVTFNTAINGVTTDGTVTWLNVGPSATASISTTNGTSGVIIDNVVSAGVLAGTSQVYFTTLGNQACGTSGTGGCAVQASQSALQ